MKPSLVTGANGHLGNNLCRQLIARGEPHSSSGYRARSLDQRHVPVGRAVGEADWSRPLDVEREERDCELFGIEVPILLAGSVVLINLRDEGRNG
jgi:nucleoside-diphosphate-sugar epimerase